VALDAGNVMSPIERRLLDACRSEGITCASTREDMLAARRGGRIARGFSTTTLGNGHLNAVGHRIVGDVAWRLISRADAAAGG
jgi:hypothetical protein